MRSRSRGVRPRRYRFRRPSRRSATSTRRAASRARREQQYALVGVIERLLAANGVRTDLETALFDVDHGVRLGRALALARQAQRARPSIDGDDVLAWALARNGRCAEALPYSRRALRLGTHDALKLLPPRDDRALPRARRRRAWFVEALAPEPALLAPLEPARAEVRVVKRLALLVGLVAALAAPAAAHRAPARELHRQPLQRDRALRRPRLRQVRPRHGRDPGLPGAAEDHGRARLRARRSRPDRPRPRPAARRPAGRAHAARPRARLPARSRPACTRFASRPSTPPPEPRGGALEFRDTNFAGRIGWKEVVLTRATGASAGSSSVPSTSVSDELRRVPEGPPAAARSRSRRATARVQPGRRPGHGAAARVGRRAVRRAAVRATGDGGFASLIARDDLGVGVILVSLALAFFWGAAHALSPGHGKAIVTAYLVGQRGKPRHAAALG